jgi:hypothetical protein
MVVYDGINLARCLVVCRQQLYIVKLWCGFRRCLPVHRLLANSDSWFETGH